MFTKLQLRKAFSSRVLDGRRQHGLLQPQLAEIMAVSVRWIQRIEAGAKLPGFYLALQLAAFLEIDISQMLHELTGSTEVKEAGIELVMK